MSRLLAALLVLTLAPASLAAQSGQAGGAVVTPQIQGGPNEAQRRPDGPARRPGMPPRDATPTPTGTARLRGRITAADSGSPLRRAQIRITGAQAAYARGTTTDVNGNYEFADLPAGRYNLTATKAGYVSLQFGQRRPFEPGRPIELSDAQAVDRVDLVLPRGGVITGRVTDEYGEPLAQVQPMVSRYQYTPDGQRRLVPSGAGFVGMNLTDDLG